MCCCFWFQLEVLVPIMRDLYRNYYTTMNPDREKVSATFRSTLDFKKDAGDPVMRGLSNEVRARVVDKGLWDVLKGVPPEIIMPDPATGQALVKGKLVHAVWCLMFDERETVQLDSQMEQQIITELQEQVKQAKRELQQG